jgi:hypothetical protein
LRQPGSLDFAPLLFGMIESEGELALIQGQQFKVPVELTLAGCLFLN